MELDPARAFPDPSPGRRSALDPAGSSSPGATKPCGPKQDFSGRPRGGGPFPRFESLNGYLPIISPIRSRRIRKDPVRAGLPPLAAMARQRQPELGFRRAAITLTDIP